MAVNLSAWLVVLKRQRKWLADSGRLLVDTTLMLSILEENNLIPEE